MLLLCLNAPQIYKLRIFMLFACMKNDVPLFSSCDLTTYIYLYLVFFFSFSFFVLHFSALTFYFQNTEKKTANTENTVLLSLKYVFGCIWCIWLKPIDYLSLQKIFLNFIWFFLFIYCCVFFLREKREIK